MAERLSPVTIEYSPWVIQARSLMDKIGKYEEQDAVERAAELFDLDLGAKASPQAVGEWKDEFYRDEILEVGERCAIVYTESLFRRLEDGTMNNLLLSAARAYYDSMDGIARILSCYWDCILEKCKENRIRTIVVAGTDGNPLFIVGKEVARKKNVNAKITLVELTRRMFEIRDEIAAKSEPKKTARYQMGKPVHELARTDFGRYLQSAIPMDNVALVDAESYGSIIRLLLRLGWRIWVFLLASNNPFLSGYLNVVTEYMNAGRTAVSELMPWHVGDSIEAIPRPYKVEELERVHKQLYVKERKTSQLYGMCGFLAYWALARRARDLTVESIDLKETLRSMTPLLRPGHELSILSETMDEWTGAWPLIEIWVKEGLGFVKPRPELITGSVFGKP